MIWLPKNDAIWTPQKDLLFRIGKYKDRFLRKPIVGGFAVEGFFRMEAVNMEDGRSRWLTGWFHNHVTDQGLNRMATSLGRYGACQVGTGNAAPTDFDTGLQTYLAGTATDTFISSTSQQSTSPYYAESYFRYDFATGAAAGNLSEVGIGSGTSGANLFSRELIRDGSGNPTTITVAANEALRVHHRLRHYAPTADVVSLVDGFIGGASASRTITVRARLAGSAGAWSPRQINNTALVGLGAASSGQQCTAYTGNLLAANSNSPLSGSLGSASTVNHVNSAYSAGSYSRAGSVTFTTAQANGNIKSIVVFCIDPGSATSALAAFQFSFDTVIPKTSLDTFSFEVNFNWGRYTP